MNFSEMGLSPELLKGITELGFSNPTPIQEKVIPALMSEMRDVIGLAQTGTGKTAAFGIPGIENLDLSSNRPQMLVLSPTRELCLQITRDLESFGKHVDGLRIVAVYGGASMDTQIRELKRGVQIIVGTPGRMNDLIRRNKIDLSQIELLVLDEADEMLKMGFREDLDTILAETPAEKNTLLFSATMAPDILRIAGEYMNNPLEFTVGTKNMGSENITHIFHMVQARDKYPALKRVVDFYPEIYGIVFCRTRTETKEIAAKLMRDGYGAEALHGDLSQAQRDDVMAKFREKNIRVLVATDVAARGLDVDKLTHVIHYNLPDDIEVYNHRSGRTGRAGETGVSVSIIHTRERGRLTQIERVIKRSIVQVPVPNGVEICERQLLALLSRMRNTPVDYALIDPFMDQVNQLIGDLDRDELIKRFVSMEFSRFLSYYKDAPDLNAATSGKGERYDKGNRRDRDDRYGDRDDKFSRNRNDRGDRFERSSDRPKRRQQVPMGEVVINLPKSASFQKRDIIQMLVQSSGVRDVEIGNITTYPGKIIAEIDESYMKKSIKNLNINGFRGVPMEAQPNISGLIENSTFNTRKKKGAPKKRPTF